jgi:hypothetical protein
MRDRYPAVAARCRAEDARILWADHSPLAGPAPGLAMTSSVDNRRQMRWAIYPEALTDTGLVDFMQRLLAGADRKLVLLMTDSPVLHGAFITQWLVEQEDSIELLGLPGWQVGAPFK